MYRLILLLFCLLCPAAWAEEASDGSSTGDKAPPGESAQTLEVGPQGDESRPREKAKLTIAPQTVVVTAGFQAGAVALEPTKTVIDLTQFESSGSVDRVEDVLKHMSGIDVIQTTGGADPQQMVMMRGFDDSRFQVAINGRPITAPTAGADTFVDWSSLTTGDIERIEVIRGSASARYENSVGGIINIITKKGRREGSSVPRASADVTYSSFNSLNTRGTVNGGVGQLGYFISFGNRTSDGFLRNNYFEGQDYSGRLDYALPGGGSLSSSYKRNELEHGYPVVNDPNSAFSDYNPDYPIVFEDADSLRMGRLVSHPGGKSYKIKKATHLDFSYDQPIKNTHLSLKVFRDWGSEDSYSYQRSGVGLAQAFSGRGDRKEKTFGVMFDYQLNLWARHSLAIGYSHRRMGVENTPDIYRIQGAYIEDQYAVNNKLTLNMGIRFMHVREQSYAYSDPGSSFKYRHLFHPKEWLPKFTATYRFNPETEIYASVNRDYHVPGC